MKNSCSNRIKTFSDNILFNLRKRRKPTKISPLQDESAGACAAVVGGAHAFVLVVSRATGLAPLGFARLAGSTRARSARWLLNISRLHCIISCLVLTFLVCFSLLGLARELRTGPTESVRMRSMTARVVGSCDVLAVITTSAVGVYGAPARGRRILRVLKLLATVDNSLGFKVIHSQERNSCLVIVAILVAWTSLLIDDFSLYANQAKLKNMQYFLLQNYLAFYLLYYVVVMLEVQFAFTAHSIYLRLKRLNDVLTETGRKLSLIREPTDRLQKTKEVFTIKVRPSGIGGPKKFGALVDSLGLIADENKLTSQEPAECIRRLSELHGTLCAAAREVDASFGLPVLIILISTLLHLIVTPYFLILEMGGAHRPHYLVLQFLWCTAHALRLLLLVEPCHRTKNEAAKTGDIVGEMLGHWETSNSILRRLELFSRQLLHRTPNFTALGVCNLDRPLIASVTAAVTTYLVILIQFQKQDDLDTERKE
ncbi:gustatory receptor 43a [Arctopsyche grandis]|uniref:gustatory receptor 43a n=1 Tax=Arctopsyche grandis TaxID=121162 RepID=UPI00406D95FF